jgi:D-threonate/D-erythronate kinase
VRLAVIADDLTGAMDTGLQFAKRGLQTLVSMSRQHAPEAEVVVVDTDSRDARASVARERITEAAHLLAGRRLYKKIDSTCRGNVGYELRALHDALGPRAIVVAPAFPAGGRTTLWGIQRVGGQPLELTFFAHDPRWPMRESYLPTLLAQQSGLEAAQVGLGAVEAGPEALAERLRSGHEPLIVVDALEQAHLNTLGRALALLGEAWLPCGSAGLAEEWVAALCSARPLTDPAPAPDERPVLVVAASRNDVALTQVRLACDERGLRRIDVAARGVYEQESDVGRLAREVGAELGAGRDVVLTASFTPLIAGGGERVAGLLAEVVGRVAGRALLAGLVLTGGDMAVAACRALSVEALRIAAEVQPGVPGGQLVGGPLSGTWVVTKAGGFGDPRTVVDALDYLHGSSH